MDPDCENSVYVNTDRSRKCNNTEHVIDKDSVDEDIRYSLLILLIKRSFMCRNYYRKPTKIVSEVDTGSGVTIISESIYRRYLSYHDLLKTNTDIKTYSQEKLNVIGRLKVNATYNEKTYYDLKPVYIVGGNGVNQLRKGWLSKIKLDWKRLFF